MIIVESIVITCKMSRSPEADHFSSYEGILDFNQVGYTFTPITYKIMISYHSVITFTFNFGAKGTIDLIVVW